MESHHVEFSEPEHSSSSQFPQTETDANRLTDAVQDAILPDDVGIYVSSEELAQIVEMKTQFDQARIDVDQLREELRILQESYDNYKLLSEKKVKEVQEEAQEAYKQRMTTSRDLQLARSETEDMRAKLSAKLSGTHTTLSYTYSSCTPVLSHMNNMCFTFPSRCFFLRIPITAT